MYRRKHRRSFQKLNQNGLRPFASPWIPKKLNLNEHHVSKNFQMIGIELRLAVVGSEVECVGSNAIATKPEAAFCETYQSSTLSVVGTIGPCPLLLLLHASSPLIGG